MKAINYTKLVLLLSHNTQLSPGSFILSPSFQSGLDINSLGEARALSCSDLGSGAEAGWLAGDRVRGLCNAFESLF